MKNSNIENFTVELKSLLCVLSLPADRNPPDESLSYIDQKKLIMLAEQHRIIPLLFRYLNDQRQTYDKNLTNKLRELTREHTLKTLNLQSELLKVCREFNRYGITYMAIKGPQLSHFLYGDASIRVCVDLDILLQRPGDNLRAAAILIELGFRNTNLPENKAWIRKKVFGIGKHESAFFNRQTRTFVDLHTRPVGNSIFSAKYHRMFFSDRQFYEMNGIPISVPSSINYFLFLCHHGVVHQYGSLHWLADVCAFIQKYPLPIEELDEQASKLRLRKHLVLSLLLMNRLCKTQLSVHFLKKWERNRVMKILYRICIKSIKKETRTIFTLKERLEKTFYRFLLAEGFSGKADTIISILLRFLYKIISKRGYSLSQRD